MPQVEHYDDGEQTVQTQCLDGKVVSFHVDVGEEATRLRITIYPDDDPANELLIRVQVAPDIATQTIQALGRADFLRALGVG